MKKTLSKISTGLTTALLLACAGLAQADITVTGYWTMKSYAEPNLSTYSTQGICIQNGGTWYSTTQLWSGDWNQQGNEIKLYGTAPIYHGGTTVQIATVGFGELHSTGTMAGQYAEWNVPGTPPLFWDRHYAYDMTYNGATCPAPSSFQGAG